MSDAPITSFRGPWTRLSNFSLVSVWLDGYMYPSVEHAYQAAKFKDEKFRSLIRNTMPPGAAKKEAWKHKADWYKDWDDRKVEVMGQLLREKFCQEPEKQVLLSTGNRELVEGNWWNDRFWGQCPVGTGENHLGKLLMQVREEIKISLLTGVELPCKSLQAK